MARLAAAQGSGAGVSASSLPLYFVLHRYPHHAGPSGYDRFADYVGERVQVSESMHFLGETVLRLPAKLIEWTNGSYEYGRHDVVRELAALTHMASRRRGLYHFLYAEKSLRYLSALNEWRGHRIIGSFHHCAYRYPMFFRSTDHFKRIRHAVVVSTNQIEHMEGIVGKSRVSFVPYGVDARYFAPAQGTATRPLRCTCLGTHLRDFDRLPAIVRGIQQRVPDAEFYVVGAPPRMREAIAIAGVQWRQRVSDAEYLDILQNTDLLVLPLVASTAVTSVNEALACGVPVLTNAGGVSDYLDDRCSVQFRVGDVDGMIDAAVELLQDESRRREMSKAAREKGLELDWPNSVARMIEVYRRVLAE
jgi:glycosyltransferase involved in cell wall biosynthesis